MWAAHNRFELERNAEDLWTVIDAGGVALETYGGTDADIYRALREAKGED